MYLADLKPFEAIFFHTPSLRGEEWATVIWKNGEPLNPLHPSPSESCLTSAFPARVSGMEVHHGLWAHPVNFGSFMPPISIIGPASRISYKLEKKYRQLSGSVGLSDNAGFVSALIFCVVCDEVIMWRSQNLRKKILRINTTENFQINIMDCNILELICVSLTYHSCQAIWIDPIII